MEENSSERLIKILEERRLKNKLDKDLDNVQQEIVSQSNRLADLSTQMEAEEVDVEKLETTNLTSLFFGILGKREERLEKERQEMLRARLEYQNAKHRLDSLEQERDYLQRQLARLDGVQRDYQSVLADKEKYLQQTQPQVAQKLMELSEQLADINADLKELEEAISAGEKVVLKLDQVLATLGNARDWGVFDMVGGGLISTMAKHSKIDQAREHANQAEAEMRRFNRELSDISVHSEMQVEITGFETFADYFLDGLIFDWVVQSKIVTALERTQQVKGKTEQLLANIHQARDSHLQTRETLQTQRLALIHSS